MKKSGRLIPDAEVAARYGKHISTLRNWDLDPKLGFPKAIRINNRKHRNEAESISSTEPAPPSATRFPVRVSRPAGPERGKALSQGTSPTVMGPLE